MADLSLEDETIREADGEKTERTCESAVRQRLTRGEVSPSRIELNRARLPADSGRTSASCVLSWTESWKGWKGGIATREREKKGRVGVSCQVRAGRSHLARRSTLPGAVEVARKI